LLRDSKFAGRAFRSCLGVIERLRSPHVIESHGSYEKQRLRSPVISHGHGDTDCTDDRLGEEREQEAASTPASDGDRRRARLAALAIAGLAVVVMAVAIWWLWQVN
jgi:hypothetical protein